ncbi:MAG: hypothetical protein M1830_004945 [Pleopsidium flavum]|nr:MAG: hypothetical protein M1830_004945 [Pleopsidium flavum]
MGSELRHAIQAVYDARKLILPYQTSSRLHQGQHVLDLACGTGLVTLLSKQKVGPRGTVTGIDVSNGMQAVAKRKAERDALTVKFINHDITDLQGMQLLPEGVRGFDLITCAAALVVLEDPHKAIRQWPTLLAPDGSLITDVPAEDAMLTEVPLQNVGRKLRMPLPFDGSWVKSADSLRVTLVDAGLSIDCIWRCPSHNGAREYDPGSAGETFNRASTMAMFSRFAEYSVRKKPRALFVG